MRIETRRYERDEIISYEHCLNLAINGGGYVDGHYLVVPNKLVGSRCLVGKLLPEIVKILELEKEEIEAPMKNCF